MLSSWRKVYNTEHIEDVFSSEEEDSDGDDDDSGKKGKGKKDKKEETVKFDNPCVARACVRPCSSLMGKALRAGWNDGGAAPGCQPAYEHAKLATRIAAVVHKMP